LPWRCVLAVLALSLTGQSAAAVRLTAGMVIDRSVTIRPATYRLAAAEDLTRPAVIIRGDNVTVDFNGAILAGGPGDADPDSYAGVGILVDGGRNVTVKNAKIRGYKIAIRARQSPDLQLTNNDLSYNWKPRLYSGVEQESLVDWMSYHQNDRDEWLSRGAAVHLSECDRARIDGNTIVQGQNGLMVARSHGLLISNNTIQFMSGIGIGFYRTSDSSILHNRIDWCIRGYSHGFYNRGQDSAGLLMYEQSSRNKVAYNSITHGGDGLFLWAGQSTMDTGQGGSNDNTFQANDFSHAATNGIEATFSRNTLRALGPDGQWQVASVRGARVSPRAGHLPAEIVVTPTSTAPVDFTVTLEYRGGDVVSPRGAKTAAGRPYLFGYSRFFMPVDWTVRFFAYGEASDPTEQPEAFAALLAGKDIGTLRTNRLDYVTARPFENGVPADHFALVADGSAALPPGEYVLQVISDEGVRVWMDETKILDEWTPHESKVSRVPIRGGHRRFKVEYYEIGGFAELRFDIQRK
jgi:parallel beta-helix repeat protein